MNNEIFLQYADVEKTIKLLTERKEALRAKIIEVLPEDGFENEVGKFAYTTRTEYEYSAALRKREAELEAAKQVERTLNKAKVVKVTKSLRVTLK